MRKENDVEVEVVKGGLLELSVEVDGEKVIETNRLWYPLPGSLAKRTREFLTQTEISAVEVNYGPPLEWACLKSRRSNLEKVSTGSGSDLVQCGSK